MITKVIDSALLLFVQFWQGSTMLQLASCSIEPYRLFPSLEGFYIPREFYIICFQRVIPFMFLLVPERHLTHIVDQLSY